MPLSHFFLVLRARWLLLVMVMACVVAGVLAVTSILPRMYTANAMVVLDAKSPDVATGIVLPGMTMSGYVATQVDVLRSERVALKAIAALKLDERASYRAQWTQQTEGRGDYRAWLAELLQRGLDVQPGRESNAINVTYTASDPVVAASMANAIVQGFMETTLELKVDPARQYAAFFDDRAKELRRAVEQAQDRLTAFERTTGVTAKDDRVDAESAKLAELTTQFVAMQSMSSDSGSREVQASTNADRMQEVLGNAVVSDLTTDAARQEAKLKELTARLGERHPEVVEARAYIQQLRDRLNSQTTRLASSVAVTNSVNQSRLGQARAALDAQRAKVASMRVQRDQALILAKDVENAQRAYDAIYSRVDQTSLESQMTQTNVSVLKRASAPAFPSQPRTQLNAILSVVLGLLLGIGACVLRESTRPVLRTELDVIEGLNLPLIGVLPRMSVRQGPRALAAPSRAAPLPVPARGAAASGGMA